MILLPKFPWVWIGRGDIENPKWLKGSGDDKWDATVKQVFKLVKNIDRPSDGLGDFKTNPRFWFNSPLLRALLLRLGEFIYPRL